MRIQISLSADQTKQVLAKMFATINSPTVPDATSRGMFSKRSCYGSVAHYLRDHWDDTWVLWLFGVDVGVTHCCLYTKSDEKLVDTFSGYPSDRGYVLADDVVPLLVKTELRTLKRFKNAH